MATAKLNRVTKATKPRTCEKCRQPINKGEPYLYWAFRYGGKHVRCSKPSCAPESYELEGNSKRRGLLEAAAQLEKALEQMDPADMASGIEDAANLVEGVAEEFQENVDAWEGGNMGHLEQCETYRDAAQELSDWVDQARSVAATLNDLNEQQADGDDVDDDVNDAIADLEDIPDPDF